MINAYHANFLRCLSGLEVEFLVIGGQARERHGGSASTDLDLWVNHSKENLDRFCKVFDEWLRNFRHHVSSKYYNIAPEMIPIGTQIHLPDADVVVSNGDDDLYLNEKNNIDILFSLGSLEFSDCANNALYYEDWHASALGHCDWQKSQEAVTEKRQYK